MFSANHRQHLLVALRHLDATLSEVLAQLGGESDAALFRRRRADVDPRARERAAAAILATREAMRAFLAKHEIHADDPRTGATHAADTLLALAMVNATELGPRYLRGYGELSEAESEELETLAGRLRVQLAAVIRALPEPPA